MTERWLAGFFAGFLITLLIGFLVITLFSPNAEPCKAEYNVYAGDYVCENSCSRYSSIGLQTYSYIDSRWHCSCEQNGEVVLLW